MSLVTCHFRFHPKFYVLYKIFMQKKLVDAKISCNFASDLRRLIFHINLIEPPICEDRRFFVSSVGAFSFPQLAQVYFYGAFMDFEYPS